MAKNPRQLKRNLLIVLKVLALLFFLGLFMVGGVAFGFVASIVKDQKVLSYEEMKQNIETNYLTGFAYFNDGTLIGKLPAEQDRRLVTLKEISPYVIDALISTEDKQFYSHHGVSLRGTARAIFQQFTGSEIQTGGSTITQQLVKQTLLEESYRKEISGEYKGDQLRKLKYNRKLNEIFLALRLERFFTKDQILEAYLNEMYFGKSARGSNLYGIQSAAKGIFGVDAKDLNLPQAAYLVGMLQNPGYYLPFKDKTLEEGLNRMKHVLEEMKQDGKITQAQYDEAIKYDIKAHLSSKEDSQSALDKYPFLLFEILERSAQALVEEDLIKQGYDINQIYSKENKDLYNDLLERKKKDILTKGYNIYTTIDKKLYDAFQAYAANPKNFWSNKTYTAKVGGKTIKVENAPQQLGAVLIDNKTGAILASIGGRDFKIEQTNHTASPRQPGSAMKPILAYAPAFETGVLLGPESPIDDSPIVLNYGKSNEHTPLNYDNKFHGIMSAREALKKSWNVPAIRVYLKVGIPEAQDFAKTMGITTLTEKDLQAQTGVIGGLERGVTVEELTNAYATFANGGTFIDAYLINRITTHDGQEIYKHRTVSKPVYSPETAYMITDMMRTVYQTGTGAAVRNMVEKVSGKHDFAGKTGTTNDANDLWFVGYSPSISLGVWTGFDIPYSMGRDQTRAKILWAGLMNETLKVKPDLSPKDLTFEKPPGIVNLAICSKSGELPSDLDREAGTVITGMFNKANLPTETCTVHQKARAVAVDNKMYLAQDSTPDDLVISKIFIKREPFQFPTKTNKPQSFYLPLDWMDTLPTEVDPRQEDGKTPSSPAGVKATADPSGKGVLLTWNNNPEGDVAGYRIYRSTGLSFERIASILQNMEKKYTDPNGSGGSGYYITAVDIAGNESAPSEVVTLNGSGSWNNQAGIPSRPSGIKIAETAAGVELTWDANPDQEQVTQYNIYYSAAKDGPFELLGNNSIPYFQHLTVDKEGWYQITAVNHVGESQPSKPVSLKKDSEAAPPAQGNPSQDQNGNPPPNPGDQGGSNPLDIPLAPGGTP
ncbi:MAG: transglycosylase domain-containing protein [Thermicanus sp.]|nr:transglycosylase domain-containing protein [Thermicanus sp.]